MSHARRSFDVAFAIFAASFLSVALGLAGVAGISAGPAGAAAAPTSGTAPPALPQTAAARQGAQWLAGQFVPGGYIPTTPGSASADLSATAQSILALSAANAELTTARTGLGYLQAHQAAFVTDEGATGPGQVALLILDNVALGDNPRSFGGTNLVTELLATEQTSGADAGLFGTQAQVTGYAAGTYQQGLALAALAAAGVRDHADTAAAISWLVAEQCPGGGWTTPDLAVNTCNGTPVNFAGPDTNSTSVAVDGLAAQGALAPSVAGGALSFLTAGQDADAGWSYYPNSASTPGTTDPDSTALVIQALVALGVSPQSPSLVKGTADPVSALLSFQLTSGSGAGGFFYPPAPAPANLLATYQAVPALAGLTFPFGPSGGSYWLVGADGGVFAFGGAGYYGSLPALGVGVHDIVGMAPTPDGRGYWLVGADGGVFAFGDAGYQGSLPGLGVGVHDIVSIAPTPDGRGYWLVGADGGVFAFGDAGYQGSLPGLGVGVHDI
ncbi:MAG: prenyltransferase/squalene oxidase repeat-containing protein, partial [Acidimicrobiales bacterium]